MDKVDSTISSQSHSLFLRLPKELRCMIYELVLQSQKHARVGNRGTNDLHLALWPIQPSITRVCQLLRAEALGLYYATAHFLLNIQRPSGEAMVLAWLDRLSANCPHAFNKLKHVTIVTGLGYREPPKEYEVDMQRSAFISATRPCAAAYLYTRRSNLRCWTRLVSGALKKRMQGLRSRDSAGFNVGENLREIIAVVGELDGYGLYDDFSRLVEGDECSVADSSAQRGSSNTSSALFSLPKELRLAIYEYVLAGTKVTIGQRAISDKHLSDWSVQPGLTRTCSLLRSESLPVYFSSTHFTLNIQRTPCEEIVLEWIRRNSRYYPEAFQNIRHVTVTAGSGIRQPPRHYGFIVPMNMHTTLRERIPPQAYELSPSRWYPPPYQHLNTRLKEMPRKGEPGFDAAHNLRGIVDVLARYSD